MVVIEYIFISRSRLPYYQWKAAKNTIQNLMNVTRVANNTGANYKGLRAFRKPRIKRYSSADRWLYNIA